MSPMTLMLITPPDVCVLAGTTHVTATAASTGAGTSGTSVRVGERKILQVGAESFCKPFAHVFVRVCVRAVECV